MRVRLALWGAAAGGALALAAPAPAQDLGQMPGMPVGQALPRVGTPVGTQLPRAAPPVGRRVGGVTPPSSPIGPGTPGQQQPNGVPIDMKNVIAPYPGQPKPEATIWEKLEERWFALLIPAPTPGPAAPAYTPGLTRRNRERREERMRRWD